MWVYKKLRRNVKVGGVSMFVVAGAISRSGRAGYMKLPARNLKQGPYSLLLSCFNLLGYI
jgi:hypothetical protein